MLEFLANLEVVKVRYLKNMLKNFNPLKKIVCISPVEDLPNSIECWYESEIPDLMEKNK